MAMLPAYESHVASRGGLHTRVSSPGLSVHSFIDSSRTPPEGRSLIAYFGCHSLRMPWRYSGKALHLPTPPHTSRPTGVLCRDAQLCARPAVARLWPHGLRRRRPAASVHSRSCEQAHLRSQGRHRQPARTYRARAAPDPCSGLRTTSAAPRPHLGRTSAAPRLPLGRTSAAPRLPLGCPSAAPRLPLGCPSAAPRLPLGCHSAAPRPHLGHPSAAPRLHLGCTSAAPRLHLGRTSAAPRPHLGCTSQSPSRLHTSVASPARNQYAQAGEAGAACAYGVSYATGEWLAGCEQRLFTPPGREQARYATGSGSTSRCPSRSMA